MEEKKESNCNKKRGWGYTKKEVIGMVLATILILVASSRWFDYFTAICISRIEFNDQWALRNRGEEIDGKKGKKGIDINIDKAWEYLYYKEVSLESVICLADTGIYSNGKCFNSDIYGDRINTIEWINNEQLLDSLDMSNPDYTPDFIEKFKKQWNFVDDTDVLYTGARIDMHGTNLASVIVGAPDKLKLRKNNIIRDALTCRCIRNWPEQETKRIKQGDFFGVNQGDKLVNVKVFEGDDFNIDTVVKGVKYACESDGYVNIVNCSWSFEDYNEELYNIMKEHSDILFVCAAGDSGVDLGTSKVYPACYDLDNIITVGAIDCSGDLAETSNYGEYVDIVAPGVDITCYAPENALTKISGTDVATAIVSGVAGLVRDSGNGQLKASEIKKLICKNCKPLDSLEGKVTSGGMIDAYSSVKKAYKKNKNSY